MGDYFMAEGGRTLVDGTKYVYYSNKKFKTGGTLRFGGFHTENYYNPDVPMYIAFYCKQAGILGGETGIVDMVNLYKDLRPEFKAKLESKTFSAGTKLVSEVIARYNVSESEVIAFCHENDLKLTLIPETNDHMISYYKSTVFDHPYSKEPALIANFGGSGMENGLIEYFKGDYKGWRWILHRMAWRFPILVDLGDLFSTDFELIKEEIMFRLSKLKIFAKRGKELTNGKPIIPTDSIESVFSDEDAAPFGKSLRKNFNSFKWKTTDILLLDNFRVAHAGMPGLGSRTVRIILANPVKMRLSPVGPGRQSISLNSGYTSFAERIHSLSSLNSHISELGSEPVV
jgi:hypothetical protein